MGTSVSILRQIVTGKNNRVVLRIICYNAEEKYSLLNFQLTTVSKSGNYDLWVIMRLTRLPFGHKEGCRFMCRSLRPWFDVSAFCGNRLWFLHIRPTFPSVIIDSFNKESPFKQSLWGSMYHRKTDITWDEQVYNI